ncbi:MAG: ETC complex I subunit [Hyphomonadaceae bacterium]
MLAKIFRPARNAMQSGTAKSQDWVLEFDSATPRTVDPLMGWISNGDTNTQVRLTFETREEAIAYARRQGIPFQVTEPREPKRVIKAYADNFSAVRKRPWTH